MLNEVLDRSLVVKRVKYFSAKFSDQRIDRSEMYGEDAFERMIALAGKLDIGFRLGERYELFQYRFTFDTRVPFGCGGALGLLGFGAFAAFGGFGGFTVALINFPLHVKQNQAARIVNPDSV